MDKCRRYVCLAANHFCRYPFRRIDASALFYPTDQGEPTTAPPVEHPLPRPCFSFTPSPRGYGWGSLDFLGFFGRGEKKTLVAAVDYDGVSQVYDIDDRIISVIASPRETKTFDPFSVALGNALYVFDRVLAPGKQSSFEALTFGSAPPSLHAKPCWHWRSLKPPPFMSDPGRKNTGIGAYTVAGDSSILISAADIGTYSFDTVSGSWDKVGDWELPFYGRAEFLLEHGAWLGFSAQDNRLCCSLDLGHRQPVLDMVWDDPNPQLVADDPNPLRYTRILKLQLVHLGCRNFCVAKLYETTENEYTEHGNIPQHEMFIVFTGLVLKPNEFGRGIEMVPHKSLLYRLEGVSNVWIF